MKKRLTLFLACFCISMGLAIAQNRQVTGVVVDQAGAPVAGASVLAKGTTTGTLTDPEGRFTMYVPEGVTTIAVRYIGYAETEAPVAPSMRIVLQTDEKAIDEVVVTALGITRSKKTLGYSTVSVSGSDIVNAKTVNPMAALQAKVSGLEISASPTPGGTQNVNIRGFNVLNRNSQPLYVVDGIPLINDQNQSGKLGDTPNTLNSQADFGSGINALNPNDIENITVLKGSAASALYGSRAASGVIIITTKAGKNTNGKVLVNYDGGVTVQQIGRLPTEQTLFGQGWSGDRLLDENGNWGARFDGKNRVWGNVVDNSQQLKPYAYLENRIRDFYDLGLGYNNALSLTGGTEQTQYHVSVSQNHIDGPIPTNDDSYDRYTIGTNASHKNNKLTLSSAVNFSVERNEVAPTGQDNSIYRSLNEIATDISIVDLKDYSNKFNNVDSYFTPYGINPYYALAMKEAVQDKYKFFGKVQMDYDLLKSLKLTYRFGGDFETATETMHVDALEYSDDSPNKGNGSSNEQPGSYSEKRRQRIQTNHELMANYAAQFGDFSLNVIAGGNANEQRYSALEGIITSIDVPGFYHLNNSLTPAVANQESELYRILGAYVNADFGYKDYLYLTLTARNDWSSTLPEENNSYFYPASMLSFIATDFLKQQNISTGALDFAKLRLAYGRTGKDAPKYGVYERFVASTLLHPGYPSVDNLAFPLAGINGWTLSNTVNNPNLKPELTDEFEVGAEMYFFDRRIGLDVAYYNKFTQNLIDNLPYDPSTGYTVQIANLGDVRNSGIELTLSLTPLKVNGFSWDIAYNFTKNNNIVERLEVPEVYLGGYSGLAIYAVEGKALGQFKSQKAQTVALNGVEHTVVDGAGNPVPTPDAVYLDKDINENFRMGLTNTFTYKGLSLSGTFDLRYGGHIYSYTKDYMHWVGSGPETAYNDRNPFIVPNSVVDNGDGTYSENTTPVDPTALHTFYSNGGFQYSDFAIIDRSYLKLRNLSLAYQLPQKACSKIGITALRLSLTASNILLWTPAENQYIDPEVTTFGNDISAKFGEFAVIPPYQSYIFGLSLSF
ncbi:MAG: SusC/RagA family TonB-linked outer membrane protein [Prevotellaceae bacterium]|jgi:TonB-linked SusC/RagA family outer membrane protein|nr:SusC/RagA family TonB-linked outer membrane protein [Prevotellaceae bacterium]